MTPDPELLRRYVDSQDEAAFAELVRRHVDLVYAAALRLANGHTTLAKDATQTVFTDLARKANSLRNHPTLTGWLHTSVRYTILTALRNEHSRQKQEQEAAAMTDSPTEREICWAQLRPLLDEAIGQLREAERDALLLRFFGEKSHREIGVVLGVTEGAAQMRVERALEKLRAQFSRRGVTASAALLATTLGAQAATVTAPVAFVASMTGQALTNAGETVTIATGLRAFFSTKARTAFVSAVFLATIAFVIFWAMPKSTSGGSKPIIPLPPNLPAPTSTQPVTTPQPTPNMTPTQVINAGTLAAALLATASVATAQPAAIPPPPPPINVPADAQPFAAPITVSPAAFALAKNNNQFALDLYHQLAPSGNGNAFFSPYSISVALAMTTAGARADTATQMTKALYLDSFSGDTMPPAFAELEKGLVEAQSHSGIDLYIANSLWPEQSPEHPLLPDYLNTAQKNFHSVVFPTDFKNHANDAIARINQWVSENTKDKIKDILHPHNLDSTTRLVLVNAIYFKGAWASAFQTRDNVDDQFHLADGSSKPVVLMHQTFAVGGYAKINDAAVPLQILSLNYFGTPENNSATPPEARGTARNLQNPNARLFSLVVLLPQETNGLAALEKIVTADQLSVWVGRCTANTKVDVFLPKFKLNTRYDLKNPLMALGIVNAFADPTTTAGGPGTADFSGMNGARDFFIGTAIHQAFIDVNENGTEAAAATVVGMRGGAGRPPSFRADHPFLFLIRDNTTGSILFLGRLANPD